MNKYAYIVDSAISLNDSITEDKHVYKVYYDIIDSEGNMYQDDNQQLTSSMIEEKLDKGITFQSNAVSPGKVIVLVEDLLSKYEKIILFTISSGLSSFYQNSLYLQQEFKDRLYVVDTFEIGYGITSIVEDAKRMLEEENKELNEVLEYASNRYKYNYTVFTCASWEPLRKSGRAPSIISKTLDLLKTKPIIRFYIKNKFGGIVTTFKKQVSKMIEGFFSSFKNISNQKIKRIVFYNNKLDESDAQHIRQSLSKAFNFDMKQILECYAPNLVWIYTSNKSFGIHIQTY